MPSLANQPSLILVSARYQSTWVQSTPAIDRLAKNGVILNRYYSAHVCAPARASLLTGRYTIRTGFWCIDIGKIVLPLTESLLGEELQSAGCVRKGAYAHASSLGHVP